MQKGRQTHLPDLSDDELALVLKWIAVSVPVGQWSKTIAKSDLRMLVQHVAPLNIFIKHLRSSENELIEYLKVFAADGDV